MLRPQWLLPVLFVSLALSGCDRLKKGRGEKGSHDDTEESDEPEAKPKKKAPVTQTSTSDTGNLPAPPPSAIASGLASALARASQIPTVEEFARAPEVTVKGSSALGCETKMVRTWLRISCRGKNDTGGTPVVVRVGRGGGPNTFALSSSGVTSLVFPYVEGVDVTAVFSWTDKSHRFVAKWPRGAARPAVLATFEGAASPLDGTTSTAQTGVAARFCKCLNQVRPGSCSEPELGNPFCDATYKDDCRALVECTYGEPGRMPTCPKGTRLYAMNDCAPVCDGGAKCPSGLACDASTKLCL